MSDIERKLLRIGPYGYITFATGDDEPTYSGTVNPDGPAAVREIRRLNKELAAAKRDNDQLLRWVMQLGGEP